MKKPGWTGEWQGTVRVKKALGTNSRVPDWWEIKQNRHLIFSYNRSLGHSVPGLVQKPRDITEGMRSLLLSILHLSNVRQHLSPWACSCSQHHMLTWQGPRQAGEPGAKRPCRVVLVFRWKVSLQNSAPYSRWVSWARTRTDPQTVHWWEEPSIMIGLDQFT